MKELGVGDVVKQTFKKATRPYRNPMQRVVQHAPGPFLPYTINIWFQELSRKVIILYIPVHNFH